MIPTTLDHFKYGINVLPKAVSMTRKQEEFNFSHNYMHKVYKMQQKKLRFTANAPFKVKAIG